MASSNSQSGPSATAAAPAASPSPPFAPAAFVDTAALYPSHDAPSTDHDTFFTPQTHASAASHPPQQPLHHGPQDQGGATGVLQQNLEPDSHSDTDSAFGSFDGNSSSSTSLASSIMNYEYSNGRRYHGYRSGAYVLPNDDEEQDRLDLLHHIFMLMLGGKLSDVPFTKPPARVLDVGTGTGIWAIDYADENPDSFVLGTDLSPIQPTWVPPNAKFYIDDAESEWVYSPDEHFDFIHVRGMSGSINDWDRLCQQAYAHVVPGGWVEFQEPEAWVASDDDTMSRATNTDQWQKLVNDAAKVFQKEIRIADSLKQRMINQGFVDVQERIVKVCLICCFPVLSPSLPHFQPTRSAILIRFQVPIGPWPKDPQMKEIGRYQREHMSMGIEPYTLGFIGKVLGWSEQECKILIAKVVNEVRDRSLHLYIRFFFVSGRKPEGASH
jgi:SAM-dependent methyltransferase